MNPSIITVDLAKSVFEIAVSRQPGKIAERHRVSRAAFETFFANRAPAIVLLEACGSAHHWGRLITSQGHEVRLVPTHVSARYRNGNKTDRTDAKALLEAFRNEEIGFVPVKSEAIQALAALHSCRSGWMKTRTARINLIRGLLRELGVVLPVGTRGFLVRVGAAIADEALRLPLPLRQALDLVLEELVALEERIRTIERRIAALGKAIPAVARLESIPGIGTLTATATVTVMVDPSRFANGRKYASSLGLTPRERSSGSRRRLGAITKRGDRYLRTLLTHGARSVLRAAKAKKKPSRLEAWANDREQAIGHNRAAIAVANKLARLSWAVWARDTDYEPRYA